MLIGIKNFLLQKKTASLGEIASYCKADTDVVRGALEQWVHRGKVKKMESGKLCKGCSSFCSVTDDMEIYEWVE